MSACILAGIQAFPQSLSIHLSSPTYGGNFNIQCFGDKTGSINLTVNGGTPPYHYRWTTGDSVQNLSGLPVGYYGVWVTDSLSTVVQGEITLTGPYALYISGNVHKYPNDYNISCYDCYNGSIFITDSGGVKPYFYKWKDGPTTKNRFNLGAGTYDLVLTDINGCKASSNTFYLTAPDRSDWTMTGNTGTDPDNNFIGTKDSTDLIFKTNGVERIRLLDSGSVRIASLGASAAGLLYTDTNGILRTIPPHPYTDPTPVNIPFWSTKGNSLEPVWDQFIGTTNYTDFIIRTNNFPRIIVRDNGKIGIWCYPPEAVAYNYYALYVGGGIMAREVKVTSTTFSDFVFEPGFHLLSLKEVSNYITENGHLPDVPAKAEIEKNGGFEVGDMQNRLLRKIEELTLYILQQQKAIDELSQKVRTLEPRNK
jgi:hypothetical protein